MSKNTTTPKRRTAKIVEAELEAMRTERDDALEELDRVSEQLQCAEKDRDHFHAAANSNAKTIDRDREQLRRVEARLEEKADAVKLARDVAAAEVARSNRLEAELADRRRDREILIRAARLGAQCAAQLFALAQREGSVDRAAEARAALDKFDNWFVYELDVMTPSPRNGWRADPVDGVVNAKEGEPRQ